MNHYRLFTLAPCLNASHLSPGAVTCSTSSSRVPRDVGHRRLRQGRGYATVAGDHAHSHDTNEIASFHWPDPPKGHSCPTPYQIFNLPTTAPYSKSRFYELVKLYHPDRASRSKLDPSPTPPSSATVSEAIKLERYRLIVAAHTLLSDPAKRSAYDRWGAGWDTQKERRTPFSPSAGPYSQGPFTQWQQRDSDIWGNATWEDWERWRERHSDTQQEPVFTKNSTFISAVLVLAAVAGSWNVNRADTEGQRFLAARDAVHDRASKDLRRVRQMTGQRPKEERIDWFVKNREAALLGITGEELRQELREERAGRILPAEERCEGEQLLGDERGGEGREQRT